MMQLADRSLGVGQTWQNVLASRVNGTLYTNTTGRPIMVVVSSSSANTNPGTLSVDGVDIGIQREDSATLSFGAVSAVVPPGSTYKYTKSGSGAIVLWAELR